VEQDGAEAEAKLQDKSKENEIREYEAETNRLKVTGANEEQIKAIVAQLLNSMLTSPAPLGDEAPTGGDITPDDAEQIPAGEVMEGPPMEDDEMEPSMAEAPPDPMQGA
jgi:hypothetical protein